MEEMKIDNKGTKWWEMDGKLHRTDGAAVEYADGSKLWYINGRLHRTDGPAIEYQCYSKKEWYMNGKRHRVDGPAIMYPDGDESWYVNGNEINFEKIRKTYELNPNWTQWTDSEKVLFRLAV